MGNSTSGKNPSHPFQRQLADGTWVLNPTPCSKRRQEYFKRANEIDIYYTTAALLIQQGRKAFESWAEREDVSGDAPIRITGWGPTVMTPYKVLRSRFPTLTQRLTNQAFLMIYGNFEAFLGDMVRDAFAASGSPDPEGETLKTLSRKSWPGRFDAIHQRVGVRLPKRQFTVAFQNRRLVFLGQQRKDPRQFLDDLAQVRHLLVHSAGRLNAGFLQQYPRAGHSVGDLIKIPSDAPHELQLFFAVMTEIVDCALADQFGWSRPTKDPAKLLYAQ